MIPRVIGLRPMLVARTANNFTLTDPRVTFRAADGQASFAQALFVPISAPRGVVRRPPDAETKLRILTMPLLHPGGPKR